jgi:hypothetical protein
MAESLSRRQLRRAARLLAAVASLRRAGVPIHDVHAPTPCTAWTTRWASGAALPVVTLLAGLGPLLRAAFQYYAAVFDWPLDVGGKPENSTLAFVPDVLRADVLDRRPGDGGRASCCGPPVPGKREELACARRDQQRVRAGHPCAPDRGRPRRGPRRSHDLAAGARRGREQQEGET